jgi:hypothetical protein
MEMLPDSNRFNNHWPRKILVDHPFRSEEADPIGRPLDAYVIEPGLNSVSGSFRNDHQWSIAALPYVDPNANLETMSDEELLRMLKKTNIAGAFAADISRELSFTAQGSAIGFDPCAGEGSIDVNATLYARAFTHPETGSAGQYWYPTYQFEITLGALGDLPQPIPYLGLSFTHDLLPTDYLTSTIQLTAGIPGFATDTFALIEGAMSKRFRLAPLVYADVSVSAGASLLDALPAAFALAPDGLYTPSDPPAGVRQAVAGVKLTLPPLARDLDYAILNLTRLQRMTPVFFVTGSATWLSATSDRPAIRGECGGEIVFRFAGVLGTQIEIGLGLAVPLLGPDEDLVPFLDLSGSF